MSLQAYRELEGRLIRIRWQNRGLETADEDAILDEMDAAWARLSAQERAQLTKEGTRSLIRDAPIDTRFRDGDVWSRPNTLPRVRKEVA